MIGKSLRFRVMSLTLAPTLIIGVLLTVFFTIDSYKDLEKQLIDSGFNVTKPITIAAEYAIKTQNYGVLKQVINYTHRKHPDYIRNITVYDVSREVYITSSFQADVDSYIDNRTDNETLDKTVSYVPGDENAMILKSPILSDDLFIQDPNNQPQGSEVLGYIVIKLDVSYLRLQQYQEIFIALLVLAFGIILSIFFAYLLLKEVNKPILHMVDVVDKLRLGRLDTRVKGELRGELKALQNGINDMAQSLDAYRNELQENIDQATSDLRETLDQLETQNIELDIAKKNAQKAAKVKSEFLANMSHELRTPLNGVIGFARQMLKTPLTANQTDYLKTIERSAKNLLDIINDILDFSKIEANKILIEKIPFNLQDTIEEIMVLQAPSAHEKGLELTLDIDENIPTYIKGDQLRIKQVLTNIIANGIKFTNRGSIYIKIEIKSLTATQVEITFSVKDTGNGISEYQQSQLFQAFNQGDASISRRYGGTGLGLIITQNLVQRMGGQIELESTLHQGSHFWFTLSFDIPEKTEVIERNASIERYETKSLQGKSVLIIGSNTNAAEVLRQQTLSLGMKPNVHQTLEISLFVDKQTTFYDVILLNIAPKLPLNRASIERQIELAMNYTDKLILGLPSTELPLAEHIEETYGVQCLAKPIFYSKLVHAMLSTVPSYTSSVVGIENPTQKRYMHVLAVDDNPANLKLLTALLNEQVTQVTSCQSGEKALQQAKIQAFDLILMDIQMPEMDGITANRLIKSTKMNAQTPVIAVTANTLKGEEQRLLKLGMDGYLSKPIDDDKLTQILETFAGYAPLVSHQQSPQESLAQAEFSKESIEKALDWSLAINLSANQESLAKEMLTELVAQFTQVKRVIEQTLSSDIPPSALIEQIHKMHGTAAYCGTKQLKKLCALVENALRSGKSVHEIEAELFELQDEMDKVSLAAKHYLD